MHRKLDVFGRVVSEMLAYRHTDMLITILQGDEATGVYTPKLSLNPRLVYKDTPEILAQT